MTMKKFIFAIAFLCTAFVANAQVNWILKAGAGLGQDAFGYASSGYYGSYNYGDLAMDIEPTVVVGVEATIPLKNHSRWIFSPSLNANIGVASDEALTNLYTGLLFGYRARMGKGCNFVAQLGPALGYKIGGRHREERMPTTYTGTYSAYDYVTMSYKSSSYTRTDGTTDVHFSNRFMFAPMIELNFEIKRFVISMIAYYDVVPLKFSAYVTNKCSVDGPSGYGYSNYDHSGPVGGKSHCYHASLSFGYKF